MPGARRHFGGSQDPLTTPSGGWEAAPQGALGHTGPLGPALPAAPEDPTGSVSCPSLPPRPSCGVPTRAFVCVRGPALSPVHRLSPPLASAGSFRGCQPRRAAGAGDQLCSSHAFPPRQASGKRKAAWTPPCTAPPFFHSKTTTKTKHSEPTPFKQGSGTGGYS